MELRRYVSILWKWMWLILLSTGLAAFCSYYATRESPRIYQASTILMVGQSIQNPNPSSGELYTSQQLALTYIQIAKTEAVLRGVIDALGLKISPEGLQRMVNASIIQGTQLIELRVIDTDPRRAQAIANELANQLIQQGPGAREEASSRRAFIQKQVDDLQKKIGDANQRIEELQSSIEVTASAREIADKQQQIAGLQGQVNQWQTTYASLLNILSPRSPNSLSVVEPARLPTYPIAPNIVMTVALAAAIGCALAVGGALLIEYLDDTIKGPDDVAESLKLAAVGLITRVPGHKPEDKLVTAKHPRSAQAEAFRVLRSNIEVADVDQPPRSILVTSPRPREGKSLVAANLALAMAETGLKTILVDADLRKPAQHRLFGLANDYGLTDALRQATPVTNGFLKATGYENLKVVTTGLAPPNPAGLLSSKRMQKIVEGLEKEADIVIFDAPPCLGLADASTLARQVDGTLLVVDAGKTRRDAATRAKEALERGGGRIVGVMLNRMAERAEGYYSYS